mmetsp:Transcript_15673/g.42074  ORF Transcript_15673/g.42074 Transcript_15673/m.42074 type:complete len:204 (+) Transcript_15673:952-1563(+)
MATSELLPPAVCPAVAAMRFWRSSAALRSHAVRASAGPKAFPFPRACAAGSAVTSGATSTGLPLSVPLAPSNTGAAGVPSALSAPAAGDPFDALPMDLRCLALADLPSRRFPVPTNLGVAAASSSLLSCSRLGAGASSGLGTTGRDGSDGARSVGGGSTWSAGGAKSTCTSASMMHTACGLLGGKRPPSGFTSTTPMSYCFWL